MRTTLTIEDDVAVRIRKRVAEEDTSLKAVVNEALRRGLDAMDRPLPDRPRYRLRSQDLGECLVPSIDCVSEVLAYAEGETYK